MGQLNSDQYRRLVDLVTEKIMGWRYDQYESGHGYLVNASDDTYVMWDSEWNPVYGLEDAVSVILAAERMGIKTITIRSTARGWTLSAYKPGDGELISTVSSEHLGLAACGAILAILGAITNDDDLWRVLDVKTD